MKLVVGKNCGPCSMLKEWLKQQNIVIEQIIAEDNRDEVIRLGVRNLPTLILDDNTLVSGLDNIKEKLSA